MCFGHLNFVILNCSLISTLNFCVLGFFFLLIFISSLYSMTVSTASLMQHIYFLPVCLLTLLVTIIVMQIFTKICIAHLVDIFTFGSWMSWYAYTRWQEKKPICSKLNSSRPEGERKQQGKLINSCRSKPTKDCSLSVCMLKLQINFQPLFQLLSKRSKGPPDTTRLATCFRMNLPDCCPQPVPKHQVLFTYGLFTYPRTFPSSPFPTLLLIYTQGKFFQYDLDLSSPNLLYKRVLSPPGLGTCLPSPSSPAAGDSDCVSPDLACGSINSLFQDNFWHQRFLFNKGFLMPRLFYKFFSSTFVPHFN